jgi:hypothetical protein
LGRKAQLEKTMSETQEMRQTATGCRSYRQTQEQSMTIAHMKTWVAAIAIGATALTAAASPAMAGGQWHGGGGGGGWHGGGGGWHGGGGGWHGGGWNGGGWHGGGWHGGGYGYNGWHGGGYYGGGYGYGGWGWGAPLLAGGLIAGAAVAASQPYYYGNNCNQLQPVYNQYGQYAGRQWVNVCQ